MPFLFPAKKLVFNNSARGITPYVPLPNPMNHYHTLTPHLLYKPVGGTRKELITSHSKAMQAATQIVIRKVFVMSIKRPFVTVSITQ